MLVLALADLRCCCGRADLAAAMSVEALLGTDRAVRRRPAWRCARTPARPPAPRTCARCWPAPRSMASHRTPDCTRVQDAYSLRCSPQVHGAARDTLEHAAAVAERELAVGDRQPGGHPERPGREQRQLPRRPGRLRARLPGHRGRRRRRASASGAPTGSSTVAAATGCRRSWPTTPGSTPGCMIAQYTAGRARQRAQAAGRAGLRRLDPVLGDAGGPRLDGLARRRASCAAPSTALAAVLAIELLTAARALDLRAPLRPAPATAAVRRRAARRGSPAPGPTATWPPRSSGRRRWSLRRRAAGRRRAVTGPAALSPVRPSSTDEHRRADGATPRPRPARHHADRPVSWQTEAPLRMLMNNLDPEVAERPDDLVVYGGTGKAARDWASFDAIVRTLTTLRDGRDAAGPVRQAGRRDAHPRVGAAGADRQLEPGRRLGDLAGVPPPGAPRPDHVRPDDRRLVDLHRHPGHPAGHLRDVRRRRRQAVRRHPGRHADPDRRLRRHGRRAAAGRHHERRRLPDRRRRPGPAAPPGRAPLPRRGGRRPRRRGRARAWRPRPTRRALSVGLVGNAADGLPRAAAPRRRRSTSSPTRPAPTTRCRTCPRASTCADWHDYAERKPEEFTDRARQSMARHVEAMVGLPGRAAPRSSTTATRSATRPGRAATTGRSPSPGSCPPTSGRCSARARARSAGRRCPATRRTSRPPTGPCWSCSRTTTSCTAGSRGARRRSRSRGCRPGSAGSATASGTRPALRFNELVAERCGAAPRS